MKSALLLIKKKIDILGQYRAAYATNLRAAISKKLQDNIGFKLEKAAGLLEPAAESLNTCKPNTLDAPKEVCQLLKEIGQAFDKYCLIANTKNPSAKLNFEKPIGTDANIMILSAVRHSKSVIRALISSLDELKQWSENSPVDLASPSLQSVMLTLQIDMPASLFSDQAQKFKTPLRLALRSFAAQRLADLVPPSYAPIIKQLAVEGGTIPNRLLKECTTVNGMDFMKIEKVSFTNASIVTWTNTNTPVEWGGHSHHRYIGGYRSC